MCDAFQSIYVVTNRQLVAGDFLQRIREIAALRPAGIILREKDLAEEEYKALAEKVLEICHERQVPCMLHSFPDAALRLHADKLHLPLPILRGLSEEQKSHFKVLGASCHSVEDALEARRLGCTYITAGHVFATDCKRGLAPRGLDFLRAVCEAVDIPVYAIGGINGENLRDVLAAGAAGGCVMSGLMQCPDVESYVRMLRYPGRKIIE